GWRARRRRRRVHHLGVQVRRAADLCHASRLWRRADRQRAARDGDEPAQVVDQPDALSRIRARVAGRRHGAVLPADALNRLDTTIKAEPAKRAEPLCRRIGERLPDAPAVIHYRGNIPGMAIAHSKLTAQDQRLFALIAMLWAA